MEMKLVISFWQLCTGLIVISSAFGVNTFMTRSNDLKIKDLSAKVARLESEACLTEAEARKIFPSIETTDLKYKHIEDALGELKEQNKEILGFLRKKDV